jgi:hypothetical protein
VRPLYPGYDYPEEYLWSELRYKAYCFVSPHAFDGYTAVGKQRPVRQSKKGIRFAWRMNNGALSLSFPEEGMVRFVEVFNARGEPVYVGNIAGSRDLHIDVRDFLTGLHVIRISGNGSVSVKKVLITK